MAEYVVHEPEDTLGEGGAEGVSVGDTVRLVEDETVSERTATAAAE